MLLAKDYMKRFHSRSYRRLMDDLRDIMRTVPSLQNFRWSRERISNLKRDCGIKKKDRKPTVDAQEERLIKWIRQIMTRKISNKVTTALVKVKWKKIYFGSKPPSKSNRNRFRSRHGLNKDVWAFKTD